ncbi:MAG: replication-associated recombination protein A, partial [Oscillospiraceae bacterium]
LAQAVILLATAPKSNSAYMAIAEALEDIQNCEIGDFPRHLQNKHFDGEGAAIKGQHYLYPHDYPNSYVKQQYLPDNLKDKVYYHYGSSKLEQASLAYWKKIKE